MVYDYLQRQDSCHKLWVYQFNVATRSEPVTVWRGTTIGVIRDSYGAGEK